MGASVDISRPLFEQHDMECAAAATIPATPQPVAHPLRGFGDLLVTAGLVGCIIAICMRIQTMEQRLQKLEDDPPSSAKVFRPIVPRPLRRRPSKPPHKPDPLPDDTMNPSAPDADEDGEDLPPPPAPLPVQEEHSEGDGSGEEEGPPMT